MEWLGIGIWLTAYICIFTTAVTGRKGWALLTGWLVPIAAMTIGYHVGTQINGLMVLICVVQFLICRRGMADVKLWDIHRRKKHPILFWTIYLMLLVLLLYVFYGMVAYLPLSLIQSEFMQKDMIGGIVLVLCWLNYIYTRMVYTALDRIYCKKQELRLIHCHCFRANEAGAEHSFQKNYYLEGIQNGVTYYFQLTRRSYHILKKEERICLQTQTGIFGGLYVKELEKQEWLERAKAVERRDAKIGIVLLCLVMAAGVWVYWIY